MKLLLTWLSENGVTQAELARRIKVHPSSIAQFLNYHARPSLETFRKIVDETGISCVALLHEFTDKPLVKRRRR
jgi:transcriptional regulator with XRE-family HTH domain